MVHVNASLAIPQHRGQLVPKTVGRPSKHQPMLAVEFSRLYTSYSPRLLRQLQRQYRQFASEAEDVVQDVFRKLWERCLPDGEANVRQAGACPDIPEAWLSRSATNAMIDMCRSTQTRPERSAFVPSAGIDDLLTESNSTSLDTDAEEKENAERRDRLLRSMHACLESMPPHERTLLVLKYIEGLSYAEIAERTGYSRGSLGTLLLRARRNVYESIATYESEGAE